MPDRVEVHPHVVLRLQRREYRPAGRGVSACFVEVVDVDVEVHLHLLVTRSGEPGRWHVVALFLQ